ncbi:MAG: hypothetical protein U9Q97_02455 [Acidobacteriota bacterium]|nr:hypothetical protein [Acidobacteriota bacterium]
MDPNRPQTSSSKKKWFIGCGIVCGVVIIIVVLLILSGVMFVKNIVKGFDEAEAILEALAERYGEVEEYCPEPDGVIRQARIEVFLKVRELMRPIRNELESSFNLLNEEEKSKDIGKEKSDVGVIGKIRTGIGMVPQIAEFLKIRNQSLLDAGMGLGEYYYIYIYAYYLWLNKPMLDGLPFQIRGGDSRFNMQNFDDEDSQEMRRIIQIRRLQRLILPLLRNQYEKLQARGVESRLEKWQGILEAEIKTMESDRYRMPWQDGLPEVIESSLKPFRQRLEEGYSRLLNSLEISSK